MTSGFEGRPNDPSAGEQAAATEKIHRRPPEKSAENLAPTQAIHRAESPADTAKTEMFARSEPPGQADPSLPRPAWQDWARPGSPPPPPRRPGSPPGPPSSSPPQQQVPPPNRNVPTPAAPRESTPNLDRDAATRALQSLASAAGRPGTPPDDATRPMSGISPAMRNFDPAATQAIPHSRPSNNPAQQHFPSNGPGRPLQPERAWQLGATPEQPATQQNWQSSTAQQPPTTGGAQAIGGSDEPPSGRGRKGWILAGVGVVVVAAVAGAVALVSTRHGSDAAAPQAGPTPSMVSALTSARSAAPSTTPRPTTKPPTSVASASPPLIPGYQTVLVPDRGAAYDIPKDWKIDAVATTTLGTPPDTVEIAGRATDGENYCPRSVRSSAFLTLSPQADPAAAAADVGMRMTKVGWPTATGANSGKAEQLTSLDGQLHGAFVETSGGGTAPAPGCAKTFSIYTFAFPSENGNFVMTIAADTGVPKAVDKETAKKVLASIRPLPDR
ncbi:hypothetical protein [Nocardia sp. NPDC051570]|uniref:hypothetical protein n=1 Tax=Nocardia sp. NPDC051570 TaxID=3364324 RepID=UPI003794C73E